MVLRTKQPHIPTPPPPFTSRTPVPFPHVLQNPYLGFAPPPQAPFLFQPTHSSEQNANENWLTNPPLYQFPPPAFYGAVTQTTFYACFPPAPLLQTQSPAITSSEYGQPVQLATSTTDSPTNTPTTTNNPIQGADGDNNAQFLQADPAISSSPPENSDSESSSPLSTLSSDSYLSSSFDSDPTSSTQIQASIPSESQTPVTSSASDDDAKLQQTAPQPQTPPADMTTLLNAETTSSSTSNPEPIDSTAPLPTEANTHSASEALQLDHTASILPTISSSTPPVLDSDPPQPPIITTPVVTSGPKKKVKAKKTLSLSTSTPCSACNPASEKKQDFKHISQTVKHLATPTLHNAPVLTTTSGIPLPAQIFRRSTKIPAKKSILEKYIPTQKAISKFVEKIVAHVANKDIPWQKFIIPSISIIGVATLYLTNFWRSNANKSDIADNKHTLNHESNFFKTANTNINSGLGTKSYKNSKPHLISKPLSIKTCPTLIFYAKQLDVVALKYIDSVLDFLVTKHFLAFGTEERSHWSLDQVIHYFTLAQQNFEHRAKETINQTYRTHFAQIAVYTQATIFTLKSLNKKGIEYFAIGDKDNTISDKMNKIHAACNKDNTSGLILVLEMTSYTLAKEIEKNGFPISEHLLISNEELDKVFSTSEECHNYYKAHPMPILNVTNDIDSNTEQINLPGSSSCNDKNHS